MFQECLGVRNKRREQTKRPRGTTRVRTRSSGKRPSGVNLMGSPSFRGGRLILEVSNDTLTRDQIWEVEGRGEKDRNSRAIEEVTRGWCWQSWYQYTSFGVGRLDRDYQSHKGPSCPARARENSLGPKNTRDLLIP